MSDLKVLIVEDEPLIAEDIASVLEKNEFIVSAIAYNATDALAELQHNLPDLALLDINLSGGQEGLLIAEIIHRQYDIPFVFITSYSDKHTLDRAKHTEPSGYIVKPFNEAALYTTLEIAVYNHAQKAKHRYPELSLAKINAHLPSPVSEREFELLQLIYNGAANRQIAEQLFISGNTVKKHINNVYLKLDTSSRATTMAKLRHLMQL